MDSFRQLKLDQIDRALEPMRSPELPSVPPAGWIRAIREALGISSVQLAKRVGITKQALNAAERREAGGEITLNQLRRMAAQLDCELVYALVPRERLATTLDRRAEALARREVESVAHSMALEAQQTDPDLVPSRIDATKRRLLAQRWSRLWD